METREGLAPARERMRSVFVFLIVAGLVAAGPRPAVGTVNARVTDKDGKQVAGASVTVVTWSKEQFPNKSLRTDVRGCFTYNPKDSPAEGSYTFLVLADGLAYGVGQAEIGKDCDLEIILWPECVLRGRVTDEQGQPVAGARVSVERSHACDSSKRVDFNFYSRDARVSEAVTAADGSFALSHLPGPDSYKCIRALVSVEAHDRALVRKEIGIDDMRKELAIVDPPACSLQGTIYLPGKSAPAPEGLELTLRLMSDYSTDVRQGSIGKEGSFVFYGLPPGRARLMLGPNYYYSVGADGDIATPETRNWTLPAAEFDLKPGESTDRELVTDGGALVRGRVVERNTRQPLKDVVVCAYHPGRPEGTAPTCTQTDADGNFALRVASGEVEISVDSLHWAGEQIDYQPDEKLARLLRVEEGEETSDLVFEACPSDCERSEAVAERKPTPPDFELLPGTYELQWDPDINCKNAIKTEMPVMGDTMVKMISKMPRLITANPRRPAFRFDGPDDSGLLALVADESGGTGSGWDTGYLDLNRNWDLSDDQPLKWKAQGKLMSFSDWVTAQACQGPRDGEHTTNSVRVRLSTYADTERLYLSLQRKGAWRGKIGTSKGDVDCVVVDSNADGIYGQPTHLTANYGFDLGDALYVDSNGFGCALPYSSGVHEHRFQSVLRVGEKYYRVGANSVGNKLTVEPYDGPVGRLRIASTRVGSLSSKPHTIGIVGENGYFDFNASDRPEILPAGDYRVHFCSFDVSRNDSESIHLHCNSTQTVSIKPGQEMAVDLSGELGLKIAPDVRLLTARPGEGLPVRWSMTIGDKIDVAVVCEPGRDYACSARVFDSSGRLVRGVPVRNACPNCGGSCTLEIQMPTLKPGEYRVQLTMDTKTVLGSIVSEKREVTVLDPTYDVIIQAYDQATKANDTGKVAELRKRLLTEWFRKPVRSGEILKMDSERQINDGVFPDADRFSSEVSYYPEQEYLRVRAEVTDRFFSTDAPKDDPWRASCVELFVSPGGVVDTINQFFLIPEGDGGVPRVVSVHGSTDGIAASWKRTDRGYVIDAKIPWSRIRGYEKGWNVMPVDAAVDCNTPRGRVQYVLSGVSAPWKEVRNYLALRRAP